MTFNDSENLNHNPLELVLPADTTNLVSGVPMAVAILDASLKLMYMNSQAAQLFSSEQPILQQLASLRSARDIINWETELHQALESGTAKHWQAAVLQNSTAGIEHTLNINVTPLALGPNGKRPGLVIAADDITHQINLERRLVGAESMAAVGKLAARVAHELNNPLDGTLRYINLAAKILADVDDPRVHKYLNEARQGLMRMAQTVGDLLKFSRNTPMLKDNGNINWIVEEAIHSLSEYADTNSVFVTAAFHNDKQMPSIEGTKLFQICCNLIKNAIDAMPAGGRLTITTGVVHEQILIRFADTGPGLPADVGKVFEPFYTTKPQGKGTGLGLAICKEFVEQLDGSVEAVNAAEGGAEFTIRIPLTSCRPVP